MTAISPRVIDISHFQIDGFAASILGVIHKATQAVATHDTLYAARRMARICSAWMPIDDYNREVALTKELQFLNIKMVGAQGIEPWTSPV
jgi:hypothetical protein